jgi:hypothetical protein
VPNVIIQGDRELQLKEQDCKETLQNFEKIVSQQDKEIYCLKSQNDTLFMEFKTKMMEKNVFDVQVFDKETCKSSIKLKNQFVTTDESLLIDK